MTQPSKLLHIRRKKQRAEKQRLAEQKLARRVAKAAAQAA